MRISDCPSLELVFLLLRIDPDSARGEPPAHRTNVRFYGMQFDLAIGGYRQTVCALIQGTGQFLQSPADLAGKVL